MAIRQTVVRSAQQGNAGELDATVSVVIPVYDGGGAFRACLSSVAGADPAPYEIIVVVDGDPDDCGRFAEDLGARVFRLSERGGPARARNAGARESRGEILLFVDADVTVPADVVQRVAESFAHEPGLAALFGSYDDAPAQSNFLSQYKNLLHHYVHQTGREDASTFWGACGAIRRDVFVELGGFDENYRRPSVEDIELGCRIRRAGYRIQLCRDLQVKHLKRWGIVQLLCSDFLDRALPWTRLILRDGRFPNDLNVDRSGRVSVAVTGVLLLSSLGSWWWRELLVLSGLSALSLLVLNAPVYRFFQRKRGLLFALGSIVWHWLYFLYSGVAFAAGALLHLFCRMNSFRRARLGHSGTRPHRNRRAEAD